MLAIAEKQPTDHPIYWFAIVDQALDDGDLEEAGQAVRELRQRFGIILTIPRECPDVEGATR